MNFQPREDNAISIKSWEERGFRYIDDKNYYVRDDLDECNVEAGDGRWDGWGESGQFDLIRPVKLDCLKPLGVTYSGCQIRM